VIANNATVVMPHVIWPLTTSAAALRPYMDDSPLQHACAFLSGALGEVDLDPYVSLTLLISAATVQTPKAQDLAALHAVAGSSDQVRVGV
jgi:hypothetical protein